MEASIQHGIMSSITRMGVSLRWRLKKAVRKSFDSPARIATIPSFPISRWYIKAMKRFRQLGMGFAAWLLLAAFANAQAMACCWLPPLTLGHQTPSSHEHACCHKAVNVAPVSVETGTPSLHALSPSDHCCKLEASGALSSGTQATQLLIGLVSVQGVLNLTPAFLVPHYSGTEQPFSTAGPPLYIALRHFLI